MKILRQHGESNQAIADRLGITEGAVRYHLRRSTLQAMAHTRRPRKKRDESLPAHLPRTEMSQHRWKQELVNPKCYEWS